MFYGYPIAATEDNWLHDCLCEMLAVIHDSIDAGIKPPKWPEIIPVARRPDLSARTGLSGRLEAYEKAYKKLEDLERLQVKRCLDQQNQIPALVACTVDCEKVNALPEGIQGPIENLLDFSFKLLTPLGIRDKQYEIIYKNNSYHVCPFCGCEYFDAPGAPREDLDHYLVKAFYPFAAANLENLAPMGKRCNESYKLQQDILRTVPGVRRQSFYPYAAPAITVRLDSSIPFGGEDGRTPIWVIDFNPNSPECTTWDDVFHLRERIKRDVLDTSFMRWLGEFSSWYKVRINVANPTNPVLLNALETYAEDAAHMGFNAKEFLRSIVFFMLHRHCANGNARLCEFIGDLVTAA